MAQLKTALPLSAIEKMAVEYLLNPRSTSHIHHNKPGMAYEIWRLVNSAEGPYAHIKKNFHDKRVVAWIKFCIDALIKKNVLVQEEDTYRSLRLSDEYLVQQTQDFSLDEGIALSAPASEIKALIIDEVITLIKRGETAYAHLIFGSIYNKTLTREWSDFFRVREKVFELINELVKDDILQYDGDINDELPAVTLTNNYLEQQVKDFTLDESVKKDLNLSDKETLVKDEILDLLSRARNNECWIVSLPISIIDNLNKKGISITTDDFKIALEKLIDTGFIERIERLNNMDMPVIITRLSNNYIERETTDFNLDESKIKKNPRYVIHGEYDDDITFNEDAVRDDILKWVVTYGDDNIDENDIVTCIFNDWPLIEDLNDYTNPLIEKTRDYLLKLIDKMIDDGIFEKSQYQSWEVIKIAPGYLENETKDFNLDEGISYVKDEKIRNDIIEILAINKFGLNLYTLSVDLAEQRKISNDEFIKFLLCVKDVVMELHREGTVKIDKIGVIQIADEYLENAMQNFNLDEGVENSDLLQDEISNYVLEKLAYYDNLEYTFSTLAYVICYKFFNNDSRRENFSRAKKILYNLRKDGKIIFQAKNGNVMHSMVRIAPGLIEKETENFNLDESIIRLSEISDDVIKEKIIDNIVNFPDEPASTVAYRVAYMTPEFKDVIADDDSASDYIFGRAQDVMDAMIEEGIIDFVRPDDNIIGGIDTPAEDRRGPIVKISSSYLEKATSGFNLDESRVLNADIIEELKSKIENDIIDILANNEHAWEISQFRYIFARDIQSNGIEYEEAAYLIDNVIQELADSGDVEIFLYPKENEHDLAPVDSDNNKTMIKISPSYYENETKDFNLDESVDSSIISPAIQQMIINFIIEKLSSLPEDEEGHSVDFLVFMISRKFFGNEAHREERIVRKIVKELVDEEKIIVINHDIWEEVRISPEFVAKETANFNLDEARYFNVENDEYDFDEQAIIDLIIKEVKWRMINGPNLSIIGYVRFIGDRISPYSGITSHATPCKEFAFLCIKKLLKQNVLTEKPNVNGANVIMLSDEYLEHETENFTLDESVDNSADKHRFFVFDGKGRIHFDEEKSRSRIFNSTADFMTSDTLASINDIIMDVFDEYHNETVNWPFAASCAAEDYFAALIVKMEKEGILTIDGPGDFDRNVRINDDYLEKETSDFNLDS